MVRKRRRNWHDLTDEQRLEESLKPIYRCELCYNDDEHHNLHRMQEYEFSTKKELLRHFIEEHGYGVEGVKSFYQDKVDYRILEYLVTLIEEGDGRQYYFSVKNKELYEHLDQEVNNQYPRRFFDKHNMISKVSYDKTGCRIYVMAKQKVVDVVDDTDYLDLKVRLGIKQEYDYIRDYEARHENEGTLDGLCNDNDLCNDGDDIFEA